jgi:hypothetical protein
MIENLKRDSVVVSFVLYPLFYYDNPSFSLLIVTIIYRPSKGFSKPGID